MKAYAETEDFNDINFTTSSAYYGPNSNQAPIQKQWEINNCGGIRLINNFTNYLSSVGPRGAIGIQQNPVSINAGPSRTYVCDNTGGNSTTIKVPFTTWSREADCFQLKTHIAYPDSYQTGIWFDFLWVSNNTTKALVGSFNGLIPSRSDENVASVQAINDNGYYTIKITESGVTDYDTTSVTGLIRVL